MTVLWNLPGFYNSDTLLQLMPNLMPNLHFPTTSPLKDDFRNTTVQPRLSTKVAALLFTNVADLIKDTNYFS